MSEFNCHKISEGCGEGELLVTSDDMCFYLVDPPTGKVIEDGHELYGTSIAGKVLVFPNGKGSSVVQADGLFQLQKAGNAPKALVIQNLEAASSTNGNTVTVIFNTDGLTWLKSNPGAKITTTFTGTVSSVGSGTINNKAYLDSATEVASEPANPTPPDTTPGHDNPGNPDNPNNPSNPSYPGTPSNQVDQNWGDLQLFKQDAGDHSTGLAGASFQVYAASAPYAADCSSVTKTGDPITVNNVSTFNSQDGTNGTTKGAVSIPGLFVSDSANATVNAAQRCYVVVETVAPAGYVLDSTPRGVAVKTGITASGTYALKIDNSKEAVPGLPLTGAQAQVVLIMLGVALLLTAAGIVLVSRRRRAQRSA